VAGLLPTVEASLRNGSLLAYPVAYGAGLLASLSPCIYPLIPVTLGYLGSRRAATKTRAFVLSLGYVAGIATTYAILGGVAALGGGLFGRVATHPLSLLFMGNLLILLALAELDLFQLPTPLFLSRPPSGRPAGVAGACGVGLAAGLVVSPCTAPVFGALLVYVAARHNLLFGMTLMFTFALGMGTLLLVLGTSAGLIARMPRSGAWLAVTRKITGILLLVAGEYYLVQSGRFLE
jgi:cytochrome c-type biogenesis protein